MEGEETTDPLWDFLNRQLYYDRFKDSGYDDLETAKTMSEEELLVHVGIELPGHRRKIFLNFAKPSTSTATSAQSKTGATNFTSHLHLCLPSSK